MDINEIKADLQLVNLYFPSIEFSRKASITDEKLNTDIKRQTNLEGDLYSITLTTTVLGADLSLKVVAKGVFRFSSNIEDPEVRDNMIKTNGAAIMFPYVRSQISLVTSQPGMCPVILPAINVTKLIHE